MNNLEYNSEKCIEDRRIIEQEIYTCNICNNEYENYSLCKFAEKYCLYDLHEQCKERNIDKIHNICEECNIKGLYYIKISKLENTVKRKDETISEIKGHLRMLWEVYLKLIEEIKVLETQIKIKDTIISEYNINTFNIPVNISDNNIKLSSNVSNYLNKVGDIDLEIFDSNEIKYELYKKPKKFYKLFSSYLVNDTTLKNKVICSDISRSVTYYMKDGVITKDIGAINLLDEVLHYKIKEIQSQISNILEITNNSKDCRYKKELKELEDLFKDVNEYEDECSIDSNFIKNVSLEFTKKIPKKTDIPFLLKNINNDGHFFKKVNIDTGDEELLELVEYFKIKSTHNTNTKVKEDTKEDEIKEDTKEDEIKEEPKKSTKWFSWL
jgi:hypothetical protein